MTSFSSLLSTLNGQPQAPGTASSNAAKPTAVTQADRKPNGVTDRFKLTPNNAAAGVKRRSEEPESLPKSKLVKTEQNGLPNRPVTAGSRFQLSAKSSTPRTSSPASQRPGTASSSTGNVSKPVAKPVPKPGSAGQSPAPASAGADGAAKKKGFASILEKAKAAEAAARATAGGGIKHKPVEKLTKKERMRLREEQLAAQKAGKKGQLTDRSRSGTPVGSGGVAGKKGQETSYKGTMKKPAPEPLAYKGTMRPAGSVPKPPPKKGQAQDKYGGYASWSDLDDAEEEDEGGYDDESDDMEGGFDDLEMEESAALRAARKEDQAAFEEEERLKREKLERKRKLMALSKDAAAKKRY